MMLFCYRDPSTSWWWLQLPTGYGHELVTDVPWVRIPVQLKTRHVEGTDACKIHRAQNPPVDVVWTATAGSDVVQSGRPIFDDIYQHLWPYIGNNTANVIFQMVKRL
ncbi:hypothetical protein TNCV_1183341 [Trichonephila clavipes]|nr:hypothetical protein TNCV_1183341 [Trichonephila clavipes]